MRYPLWFAVLLFGVTPEVSAQGTGSVSNETGFRSFPLVHIASADAAGIIGDLVGRPRPARTRVSGVRADSGPQIHINHRTNTLLVLAGREEMLLIAEAINFIDVCPSERQAASSISDSDLRPKSPPEVDDADALDSGALDDDVPVADEYPGDEVLPSPGRVASTERTERPREALFIRTQQSTVRVTTNGSEILLASDDPDVLDHLECALETLSVLDAHFTPAIQGRSLAKAPHPGSQRRDRNEAK